MSMKTRAYAAWAGVAMAAVAGCVTPQPPEQTAPEPSPAAPEQTPVAAKSTTSAAAQLKVVGVHECVRPANPEGLSGVTRLPDGRYLSIDDRGGLLWTLDVALREPDGAPVRCDVISHVALEGVVDGEGCAWDPLRGTVWVSDEEGPKVSEFDPKSGKRLGELALPDEFRKIRHNRGPEGLTISPDGLTLWTCPEEAVVGDGPLSSPTNGTLVRLHRYVRASGEDNWSLAETIPYQADAWGGTDFGQKSCSGVSGLCAMADGTLLVLEREMSVKGVLPSFRLRLYEVRPGAAKRLLLDRDTGFAMYEGICLVSEAADGSSARLLLVSDGGGLPSESVMTMALERERGR